MEAAFAWIGELMSWVGAFIPTWVHVECWETAVLVKRGRKVRELEPGVTWYWSYWSTVHRRAANRQTKLVRSQELETRDGKQVAAGCMVRYNIEDGVKALIETDDVEGAIDDETMAALCEFVTQQELEEIRKLRGTANTKLTSKTRSALKQYGVYVERTQLTVFTTGRTLIHVGHVPAQVSDED
jgi:regulator of protease activity HflC (stomatin/prohibitin superfamily)